MGALGLDAYAGVWFFTRNPEFFSRNQYVPGSQDQTQDPIVAFETHLSYDFKPRLWVSLDGNFWRGGRTSLNGVENPATLQKSSRIGVTASFPLTRRQSIKLGFADGAYPRLRNARAYSCSRSTRRPTTRGCSW